MYYLQLNYSTQKYSHERVTENIENLVSKE
jgi:hypothetical protein